MGVELRVRCREATARQALGSYSCCEASQLPILRKLSKVYNIYILRRKSCSGLERWNASHHDLSFGNFRRGAAAPSECSGDRLHAHDGHNPLEHEEGCGEGSPQYPMHCTTSYIKSQLLQPKLRRNGSNPCIIWCVGSPASQRSCTCWRCSAAWWGLGLLQKTTSCSQTRHGAMALWCTCSTISGTSSNQNISACRSGTVSVPNCPTRCETLLHTEASATTCGGILPSLPHACSTFRGGAMVLRSNCAHH